MVCHLVLDIVLPSFIVVVVVVVVRFVSKDFFLALLVNTKWTCIN